MSTAKQLPDTLAQQTVMLVEEDPFFVAPQGEGRYMGRLSAWVRCTQCNLRCAWTNADGSVTLCDTAYSSHVPSIQQHTLQTVYDYLLSQTTTHVVITGGEPTRQSALLELIDFLEEAGRRVTVETNGTRFFTSRATLVSVSPKLRSSGTGLAQLTDPERVRDDSEGFLSRHQLDQEACLQRYAQAEEAHQSERYQRDVLERIVDYYGPDRYQFKFVAHCREDLTEILEFFVTPLKLPPETVYLMPQGTTHEQLQARAAWVIEQCKRYGFNYSDRLHIRIYGNQPGV